MNKKGKKEQELKFNIGNHLAELRNSKKLSQENVAEELDIALNSVSRHESGKCFPSHIHLVKYKELYGTTMDYIFFGTK